MTYHVRTLADRLCYLQEGQDGLRRRDGMIAATEYKYWDKYDTQALELIMAKDEEKIKQAIQSKDIINEHI